MAIGRLRIEALRCLSRVDVVLNARRNYLVGPNGAGKTSFLEGIYVLGRGRSFRTRQSSRLIQHGQDAFSVFGEIESDASKHRLGVRCRRGKLEIKIDGDGSLGMAGLARLLPVYVLDPRLHDLVEAGPSERRRYLDSGVFHVEHDYLTSWRTYRRVLGQRNAALKGSGRRQEVGVWRDAFVAAGEAIDRARSAYVAELADLVAASAERLLGQPLYIEYRSGWRRGLNLSEALEESWGRDQTTGFTQVGPHRGDLKIKLDSGEARDATSRGQQKLLAAALVLGQVRLFEAERHTGGTVLVDDPVAELDRDSLTRLLVELDGLDSQLVLTGLETAGLAPPAGFPVFHVEQGRVWPVL